VRHVRNAFVRGKDIPILVCLPTGLSAPSFATSLLLEDDLEIISRSAGIHGLAINDGPGSLLLLEDFKLPPSPDPNIVKSYDIEKSNLSTTLLLEDDIEIISMLTGTCFALEDLALADGLGILTLQILHLPPPSAPNILPSSDLEVDKDFWLTQSPPPTIDTNDTFSPFDDEHESLSFWLDTDFFLSFATSRIDYVSPQFLGVNGKSHMFPYWEYWDQAASFSHSFDLLSYNAVHWFQGILVSMLNQMKCLMFLDGPAPCTHHLYEFRS
jgi:hypothetical protein